MIIQSKIVFAAIANLLLLGGYAMAECDDMSSAHANAQQNTAPVAKDGSSAPLEVKPEAESHNEAKSPSKDGSNVPLNESKNLATSQQDIEAQQQGDKTAAEKGAEGTDKCLNKG